MNHSPQPAHPYNQHTAIVDPVCGMTVDPAKSPHRYTHEGHDYSFCCAGCRDKFAADPHKYLHKAAARPAGKPAPAQQEAATQDAIYTCPMHPEIRQIGPGACPICGMALEPEVATAETGPSPELADMTRRLRIGLALSAPVVVLEMGGHLTGLHMLGATLTHWIEFVLATPVVLWAGWPFFERGWNSIVARHLNMFTLIALGTGVAWLYSVVGTLAPGLFPPPSATPTERSRFISRRRR